MFKVLFIIITSILAIVSFVVTAYFKSDYTLWDTQNKNFKFNTEIETIFYKFDNILYTIIGILIIGLIIYTIIKICKKLKIPNKSLVLFGVGIVFIVGIVLVLGLKVLPRGDQIQVLNAAIDSIQENFSKFEKSQYFDWYPYQIGIVFYIEMLLRLFNTTSYISIQLVNVIELCVTFYFMYLCIDKILKDEISKKISVIFMILFAPIYPYVTFVYGNIPGLMCAVISVYYMLKYFENNKIINLVISGVSIAFAINLKNNYLIFFIAEAIIYFINAIKNKDYKLIAVIIFAFILNKGMFKCVEKYYEIRGNLKISEGIPKNAWMVMAMQESAMAPGWFNGYPVSTYMNTDYNNEETKKIANKDLSNRINELIKNPKYTFKFYTKKMISQWCEPTFESTWIIQPWLDNDYYERAENSRILNSFFKGKLRRIYDIYCESLLVLIYTLATISVIRNFKDLDLSKNIFLIVFLGGVAFHLLWEGKSQYIWTYILCAIPYVGGAIKENKKKLLELTGKK